MNVDPVKLKLFGALLVKIEKDSRPNSKKFLDSIVGIFDNLSVLPSKNDKIEYRKMHWAYGIQEAKPYFKSAAQRLMRNEMSKQEYNYILEKTHKEITEDYLSNRIIF